MSLILIAASIIGLLTCLARRDYPISYGLLFCATYLYFICPSLFAIEQQSAVRSEVLEDGILYALLCLIAGWLGWILPILQEKPGVYLSHVPKDFLLKYIVGACLFGVYFQIKLLQLPAELLEQSQWSGPHTIYLFLSSPLWMTLLPSAVLLHRERRWKNILLVLVPALLVVPGKVVGGRRDEIVELVFMGSVVWTLVLQRKTPRGLVLVGSLAAALVFSKIGAYRTGTKEGGIAAGIQSVIADYQSEKTTPINLEHGEIINYLGIIDIVQREYATSFGAIYWNRLVNYFVPGQIIGVQRKEALKLPNVEVDKDTLRSKDYVSALGTTYTGLSDTRLSFGWLGCIVFYLQSRFLKHLLLRSAKGCEVSLFAYPPLAIAGAVGLTHSTSYFLGALVSTFVFQSFWLLLGRKPVQSNEIPAH
jgi:hypothetical protein